MAPLPRVALPRVFLAPPPRALSALPPFPFLLPPLHLHRSWRGARPPTGPLPRTGRLPAPEALPSTCPCSRDRPPPPVPRGGCAVRWHRRLLPRQGPRPRVGVRARFPGPRLPPCSQRIIPLTPRCLLLLITQQRWLSAFCGHGGGAQLLRWARLMALGPQRFPLSRRRGRQHLAMMRPGLLWKEETESPLWPFPGCRRRWRRCNARARTPPPA